ncbi:hypothetical protein [Rubrimonas cliftonensis]|uniref:Copper binding protein CusF n=1 Tax=Rubrimonas cliftonensis TaxID=89524 RepID=A0A1H3YC41_9RHOB|nr:hypothetical protein [Rubrimonas cliftonensis]SEA08512.1 hypothetical protein SAMN05444370_10313 [Rubrimonas cliftonensis]
MRALILSALCLSSLAGAALADQTSGQIATYDQARRVIVLTDRTVWPLAAQTEVSTELAAGKRVVITFLSDGDNGLGRVLSVIPKG